MIRTATVCCILAGGLFLSVPPVAANPAPTPVVKKPAKEKPKLPTTKEEFEELAKVGPPPPWVPYNRQPPCRVEHIDATVVDVSDEWIEVRVKDKKETVKYPAHTLLVTGAVCHWETDSHCYLLDDVKKGDEIVFGAGTADKVKGEECFYFSIRRRPDGVIPSSRKPSEPNPYHKRRQREVDYEDRGEYTPEELQDHEDAKAYRARRGLPPPPPLPERKPRAKPADEPKKDEPKAKPPEKKDDKK